MTQFEDFESMIAVEDARGCNLWLGRVDPEGYGRVWSPVTKYAVPAHRVAYERAHGPIPTGLVVDHICRVRSCVNTAHLRLMTNAENVLIGYSPPAKNRRKTHCLHGHAFDEVNTYMTPDGRRICRICQRKRTREWEGRHK